MGTPASGTKEQEWRDLCDAWLEHAFPMLAEHARGKDSGDRGVLVLLDLSSGRLRSMLSGLPERLEPKRFSADEFIRLVNAPSGVSAATAARWDSMLKVLDGKRDVALFLASTPDEHGHWFSRFIVSHDGRVTKH